MGAIDYGPENSQTDVGQKEPDCGVGTLDSRLQTPELHELQTNRTPGLSGSLHVCFVGPGVESQKHSQWIRIDTVANMPDPAQTAKGVGGV